MKNNVMGTYTFADSVVHRLNGKIKLLIILVAVVYTALCASLGMYIINAVLLIFSLLLSKLNIFSFLSFLKRIWIFLLVILVMNTLFFSKENPWLSFGFITPSQNGLLQGVRICSKVVLILLWSNLLLSTTMTIELMESIEFYLKPLKLFKINTDSLSLIISISISLIPILMTEADQIKKAQKARGAGLESRNIFKKAVSILPLVIPVFVSAFKRADELAQALEVRGYRGNSNDQ